MGLILNRLADRCIELPRYCSASSCLETRLSYHSYCRRHYNEYFREWLRVRRLRRGPKVKATRLRLWDDKQQRLTQSRKRLTMDQPIAVQPDQVTAALRRV